MKLLPSLLTAAFLCTSAHADLLITMRGSVYYVGPNPPAGYVFEGAQVGDPVRLSFTVATPGTTTNNQTRFDYLHDSMDLEIGSASVQSSFASSFPLVVTNDQPGSLIPAIDLVRGHIGIPGAGVLDILVQDLSGQIFNTSDLAQSLGTFATPGVSYLWLQDSTLLGDVQIDMNFMDVVELGSVGSSYCAPAVPNSTGQPATLSGYGSDIVAANSLEMQATGLPQNQFSLLLVGDQQALILNPGNSQGNLCLGGGLIGRFNDQIGFSGTQGTSTFPVDLTDLPAAFGTINVMAGQTWNFQLWYRDHNPGSTTNYTNAVEVLFL